MPGIAALLLLSENLALGKQFPWSLLPLGLGTGIWIAATLFLIYVIFDERTGERVGAVWAKVARHRLWLPALVLGNIPFQIFNYSHFKSYGYELPVPQLILCAIYPWIVRRDRPGISFLFCLALLAVSITTFPIAAGRSNMLTVIHQALGEWAAGRSPYAPLSTSLGPDRMPYLPGILFSHYPAWRLGLDLRWNQVVYRALWMGCLLVQFRRHDADPAWKDVAHFLALSPYFNFRHDLYFDFFLLLIVLYWSFPRRRWLTLPAMVVTRQWAWILAPFAAFDWLRSRRPLLGGAQLAGAGALAVALPWLLLHQSTDWPMFRDAVFAFQKKLALDSYVGDFGFTLAPMFYWWGSTRLLQPLQGLACLGLFAYGWNAPRPELRRSAVVALIGFILLNMHFWNYFWISVVVWMTAYGCAVSRLEPPRRKAA